jgi:hypothetical protein
MVAQYTCTDCGSHVAAYALPRPPSHGRCLTCQFIHNMAPNLTQEEVADLRRRLRVAVNE